MGRTGEWVGWLVLLFAFGAFVLSGFCAWWQIHVPSNAVLQAKVMALERELAAEKRLREMDENDLRAFKNVRAGLNELYRIERAKIKP